MTIKELNEASKSLETIFKFQDIQEALDSTKELINKIQEYFDYLEKEKQEKKLPETWEELEILEGYYVSECSEILRFENGMHVNKDKNVFPTKAEAKASLALAQLCQLRNVYNNGWVSDWKNRNQIKYCIEFFEDEIWVLQNSSCNSMLHFKDAKTRDTFLENFRELIEIAKPLL